MKKLEIHVFPSKTSRGKNYKVSFTRVVIAILFVVVAVLGFVMFSPSRVLDNVTSGDITEMHRQNSSIKNELKGIRENVDESILKAEETRILRDSTMKHSGMGFALEQNTMEEDSSKMHRKSLAELESTFRNLLNALEKDSSLAARIPVLHPMKNGHPVRKRFEMAYDPFTDRVLPHRGIDYVASAGDTVYATGDGTVIEVQKHRGYGLSVKIEHVKGVRSFYAHLDHALVSADEKVSRGEPIGIAGESGRESSIGLHYEIRLDGNPVNPERFFITK